MTTKRAAKMDILFYAGCELFGNGSCPYGGSELKPYCKKHNHGNPNKPIIAFREGELTGRMCIYDFGNDCEVMKGILKAQK